MATTDDHRELLPALHTAFPSYRVIAYDPNFTLVPRDPTHYDVFQLPYTAALHIFNFIKSVKDPANG